MITVDIQADRQRYQKTDTDRQVDRKYHNRQPDRNLK